MKTILAPKWAIDLATMARDANTSESRLLALDVLQSQVGCPDGLASDMLYLEDLKFHESDKFEYGTSWTHAVFNGHDTNEFKSGKLYRISCEDPEFHYFYCHSETGEWRVCLREGCGFINGNWTLVDMGGSE